MADLAFDPNKQDSSNTSTNILTPQAQSTTNDESGQEQQATSGATYVSDGNPYGKYGTPQNAQQSQNQSSQTVKKSTSTAPSSGMQTNVQSYINKNQAGSQKLGQTVSGKLQTSADLARQGLQGTEKSFQQGMDAGSLENWQGAVDEAKGAYQQAASQKAPERQFHENAAQMYKPTSTAQQGQTPTYSAEDQALINSNMARVVFGDGTKKDFKTQDEAQQAIDDWNKLNPGYYTYGDQEQLSVSDDRLADILNAKYTGPTDLYQAAGYSDVYNQFDKTQKLQDLAKSTGFKGTLLQEAFENPNMTYSLGNQLLDDLLLGQGPAAETLKQTADTLGDSSSGRIQDEFSNRIQSNRELASQRASDIADVRSGARTALDEVAQGRQGEVEDRLSGVLENWEKYPQHYRDILQDSLNKHQAAKGQVGAYNNLNKNIEANKTKMNFLEQAVKSGPPESLAQKYITLNNNFKNAKTMDQRMAAQKALHEAFPPGSSLLGQGYESNIRNLRRYDKSRQSSYQNSLKELNNIKSQNSQYQKQIDDLNKQYGVDFANYDPNNLNVGLSALEAEMLGIQGGEGLYNILSQPGGIDNLIKTAEANKEKLVSQDEQSQLARLQSIAQLADDYGSEDSGIDFRNQYQNRDLAGTQSALDALDMNNLRDVLQGAEKEFRDFAEGKTVRGTGTGKGSSGGAFGKSTKKVTRHIDANLGNVINEADGWRNIYSDEGVNQSNVDKILGLSQQLSRDDGGYIERDDTYGVPNPQDIINGYLSNTGNPITDNLGSTLSPQGILSPLGPTGNYLSGLYEDIAGNSVVADALNPNTYTNIGTMGLSNSVDKLLGNLTADVSSSLFGNSGKAKAKAEKKAYAAAQNNLKQNIEKTLNQSGYGNQLNRINDTQRDLDLLQLLGMLDTTNR